MKGLQTKKRYIFLAVVLIATASGLFFVKDLPDATRIPPSELLLKARETGHYITSDQLSERIISGDPSLLIVDLRDSIAYTKYSLPNALNVPYGKILDPDFVGYFDQDVFDVVLYSNDHLISEQAWLVLTSKNFNNIYVLKGGLNEFFNTIIQPKEPLATASKIEFDRYYLRKAAGYYYGVPMPRVVRNASGDGGISETGGSLKKKRKAIVIRKKKKKKVGGC